MPFHQNPFGPLGKDLEGFLPNPRVVKDTAGLIIAGQVYSRRTGIVTASQAAAASVGANGGAQWASSSGPISAGASNDVLIQVPRACTLKEVTILGLAGSGTCTINIWKRVFASFPPTSSDDITGGTSPAIVSGNTYSNTTLSGWTTAFAQGDVIRFHLSACSIFSVLTCLLRVG